MPDESDMTSLVMTGSPVSMFPPKPSLFEAGHRDATAQVLAAAQVPPPTAALKSPLAEAAHGH